MLAGVLIALFLQPDVSTMRRLFEDALTHRRTEFGENDARTAQAARDLGVFLTRHGDPRAGRDALGEAVRIDEAAFGQSAPQTLADVADLAAATDPRDAEGLWQQASQAKDASVAARALGALGDLHRAGGDPSGAAGFYRSALAKQEAATGAASEPVAVRLNALAPVLDPKDGIPLLQRALAIDRAQLGARHPQTATTEANLAGALVNTRRYAEAIRAADDALAVFKETLGRDHPRCAVTAGILAFALEETGQKARAEQFYRLAIEIDERAFGPDHPQTINDRKALAEFLKTLGR